MVVRTVYPFKESIDSLIPTGLDWQSARELARAAARAVGCAEARTARVPRLPPLGMSPPEAMHAKPWGFVARHAP